MDSESQVIPQEVIETKKEPEILSGAEVAERVEFMYDNLDPITASELVGPGPVLTIAGLKPDGFFYSFPLNKRIVDQIRLLNEKTEKWGLQISPRGKVAVTDDITFYGVDFYSSRGLEWKCAHSALILDKLEVPKYSSATGLKGYEMWIRDFYNALDKAVEERTIGENIDEQIIDEGIRLGYPDKAILDYHDYLLSGSDPHIDLETANILAHPMARKYQGESPVFYFKKDSENDEEIQLYIQKAREVLDGFYNSPWFKRTEKDVSFQTAVRQREELHRRTKLNK